MLNWFHIIIHLQRDRAFLRLPSFGCNKWLLITMLFICEAYVMNIVIGANENVTDSA